MRRSDRPKWSTSRISDILARRLPSAVFDYLDGGADREITLNENCSAFDKIYFRPSSAVAFEHVDLGVRILGHQLSEILRVLRNEGRAIVSLRSKETMQNYAVTKYDFHLYLPEDAAALMRRAGFRNVHVELRLQGTLMNEILVIGTR